MIGYSPFIDSRTNDVTPVGMRIVRIPPMRRTPLCARLQPSARSPLSYSSPFPHMVL